MSYHKENIRPWLEDLRRTFGKRWEVVFYELGAGLCSPETLEAMKGVIVRGKLRGCPWADSWERYLRVSGRL